MNGKVELLVAEVLQMPAEQVTNELAMTDIEAWDSLKHMELIVALETAFALELTFDEIISMRSIQEIKRVLGERRVSL